jgi:hypothetical protein
VIAQTIGRAANERLSQPQQAALIGASSRGLFLRLADGWVVFLSREAHPGPLTVQAGTRLPAPGEAEADRLAQVNSEGIFFSNGSLSLLTGGAAIWDAPARPARHAPPEERRARLASVCRRLTEGAPRGFSTLLPAVCGAAPAREASDHPAAGLLRELQASLQIGQAPAAALGACLGLGSGLTPSGDDLIMGLLLALNRWGDILRPGFSAVQLNDLIVEEAWRRTTALSASLIACAARGLGDARLLLALDGIVSGEAEIEAIVQALSAWGSSSGGDALLGMALWL